MKNNSMIAISLFTTSILVATAGVAMADSDELSTSRSSMPAVQSAFEIGLSGGYSQGVGDVANGMGSVEDYAGAGGNVELQLGYRISPNLAISAYTSLGSYSAGDRINSSNSNVGIGTAGLKADWHFMPNASVDPWVSIGGGVRGLLVDSNNGNDQTLFGWDLMRLQAGVDYRVTPELSIGPVISATATTFTHQLDEMTDDTKWINDRDVNFNFSAGLMGRFDAFASH